MDPFAGLWIVLFLLWLAWLIWMVLFLTSDPAERIRQTKRHQFLGPGGPDDPFADEPFDDASGDQR
jgi:hypothetical protein